jgi:acyl-CoA synthetase (NDP forming)
MSQTHAVIEQARFDGKQQLTDPETKQLLQQYGFPIAKEGLARSAKEASQLAAKIGWPVVLKVISPDVLHKSDAGGLKVGIQNERELREAYVQILDNVQKKHPQARIEGVLVQEYITEGTELILGLASDPAFGQAIMFGLGGIFVEILHDVNFAVVPLKRADALRVIQQTKAFPILNGDRGRTPVNMEALVEALLQLSRLAEELGADIAELDINPLLVRKDGSLAAIDTRAGLTAAASVEAILPSASALDMGVMNRIFRPKTLAIIGASNSPDKVGYLFMSDLLKRGYKGTLYPVNPRNDTILGLRAYANINDIPEAVDLAIIAVPPAAVPQVMADCAHKQVPGVVLNSAGFSETGTEAGRELERQVMGAARQAGIRIVGPNCLGIYNPSISLGYLDAPEKNGGVAVISQSGSMTVRIIQFGAEHGVGFSKGVSSGNEADLNLCDYIEYFGQDADTKIIVAYVESIRDGQRFLRITHEVCKHKPILIWKAGRTTAGAQAAASHTGALASSAQIYNAAFQQAGVIAADSFTGLLDALILIDKVGTVGGDRVAIVSGPGGMGVALADACNDRGISVPQLAPETERRLREILPSFAGFRNPIDITMAQIINQDLSRQCIKIVADDPNIDVIITVLAAGDPAVLIKTALSAKAETSKPLLALTNEPAEASRPIRLELEKAGIPVYEHPERIAQALAVALRKTMLS